MPPSSCHTSRPCARSQGAVLSQRMPPVQYIATGRPASRHALACACTNAVKSRKLRTCGSSAPRKRPSRTSKWLRLSSSTTSPRASSSRHAAGDRWLASRSSGGASGPSSAGRPSATISGLTPTFSRPNGAVAQALCLNGMPRSAPSSTSSRCRAASKAATASASPAIVPLMPSRATTMLPARPCASARTLSAAAPGSGSGTKR